MTVGLHCLECGKKMLKCIESKPIHEAVRRIKVCASCGAKMTTIEKIVGKTRSRKAAKVNDG